MKESYGGGKGAVWRPFFQQKYLNRLVTVLRRRKIEVPTSASARIGAVRLAMDLSLAMSSRGRSAWSRAILRKCILRLKKSRRQLRVVKYRGCFHGLRRSASSETKPFKTAAVCEKLVARRLSRRESRTRHNCEEEAGGTVASRMQTLRLLVPGSHGLNTPAFLKEAAEYISALKKHVQAMQALADCYPNSSADAAWQV